jgi:hypothetical protein
MTEEDMGAGNGLCYDVPHHASYLLQRGVWKATCRVCNFEVSDPDRRRASSMFRMHIRDVKTLDLRTNGNEEVTQPEADSGTLR